MGQQARLRRRILLDLARLLARPLQSLLQLQDRGRAACLALLRLLLESAELGTKRLLLRLQRGRGAGWRSGGEGGRGGAGGRGVWGGGVMAWWTRVDDGLTGAGVGIARDEAITCALAWSSVSLLRSEDSSACAACSSW